MGKLGRNGGAGASARITGWTSLAAAAALAAGTLAGCGNNGGGGSELDDGGLDADATPGTGDASPDVTADATGDTGTVTADGSPESSTGDASDSGGGGDSGDASDGADVAAPAPIANLSGTSVDFGNGDCGHSTTGTLTVQNTGNATLHVNATIAGNVFSVSPSTLTVAPGATETLNLTATVAASASAGATLMGSLAIHTDDPQHTDESVQLSVTPHGANLAFATGSPTKADFGIAAVGVADTPITLTVKNTGNAPATGVTFTAPSGPFTLTPGTATIAAGASATLTANFTPTTLSPVDLSAAIGTTGVVICGETSLQTIELSGQGGTGAVDGWPTSTVDFGGGSCGGAAPSPQSFTLTNSSPIAAHITGITFGGTTSGYATDATTSTTIPGSGQTVVHLMAPPVPFPSSIPTDFPATVTFTTDVSGDQPHTLQLDEHAVGAVLRFDTSPTQNFGAFGDVSVNHTGSDDFNVFNDGNAASNVTLTTAAPFHTATATFSIAGSGEQADTATFAPTTFGPAVGTLAISGDNLCAVAPVPLSLGGTGQGGGISISTASLAFAANCGSTDVPQTFTITNNGNQPMTWSSSTGTALYTVTPSSAGPIAPGGSTSVTVTPSQIPLRPATVDPSHFADAITITTDIPNDTAHTVALTETPLGDVLNFSPLAIDFGHEPVNTSTGGHGVTVTNNGNGPSANLMLTSSNPAVFPIAQPTLTVPGNTQEPAVGVLFIAPGTASTSPITGTITITTSDALCADIPPAVPVQGVATQSGPAVSPAALDFGLVNCGSTAGSQSVTVTNTGNQDFTITGLSLSNPTFYNVSMSPAGGLVQANNANQVMVTVTPNGIPGTEPHATVPDHAFFDGTLTITTNANVPQPSFDVPLTMGAQGAIVANGLSTTTLNFPSVRFPGSSSYILSLRNTGNAPVIVGLGGTSSGVFSLPGTRETVTPGILPLPIQFTPTAPGTAWSDQGSIIVTPVPGGVFCFPVPGSWSGEVTMNGASQ